MILACAIVGLGGLTNYVSFICMSIPLISLLYLLSKRPYNLLYNNIRAALKEVIGLLVLGIEGSYRAFIDPVSQDSFVVSILPTSAFRLCSNELSVYGEVLVR